MHSRQLLSTAIIMLASHPNISRRLVNLGEDMSVHYEFLAATLSVLCQLPDNFVGS